MNADADLSPPGIANLIADFLEAKELDGVTIVGNDSGGAISQVLATRRPERVGRLVLTNCDTHENFPPSAFKLMPPLAKLPGAMTVMSLPFRLGPVRRAAFAPFAKTKIPPELIDSWMEPSQRDAGVQARHGQGHRRTEQALHAGGGGAARPVRPTDPVRLGSRGPLLQALLRGAPRGGDPRREDRDDP